MSSDTRFADSDSRSETPLLVLARKLDLEGSPIYVVSEDGIHEGTYVGHDNEEILFESHETGEEARTPASKVHLFLRDAENHFKALARETNWGARSGD